MLSDIAITLRIQNNVNYPVDISILGNNFNTLDTVNAKTEYRWNLTSFTFTTETNLILQYKQVGASNFSNYTAIINAGNLESVVDALNNLGIGFFTQYVELGQTYIGTYNDNYVFGNLNIYAPSVINPAFFIGNGFNTWCWYLGLQSDGKIVCAGGGFVTYQGISASGIIRLNNDGSIDNTFVYGTGITGGNANDLSVQSDNKIVINGSMTNYNGTAVTSPFRINTDGSLDVTYTATPFTSSKQAIQTDDKVVFVGAYAGGIKRLNTNGTTDASFVIGTGCNNTATSVAIQPDGKIIVAGIFTSYNGNSSNTLVRINSDGSYDNTFTVGSGFTSFITGYAIAIQSDGKIIIGGNFSSYNGNSATSIVRLNTDGTFDNSFVTGTGFNNTVNAISIQPDGKIIVGGFFTTYNGVTANRIVRLNTDGSIDTTWNYLATGFNDGIVSIKLYSGTAIASGNFNSFNGVTYNYIISLLT